MMLQLTMLTVALAVSQLSAVAAQPVPDEVKKCRELYTNWDDWTDGLSPLGAANEEEARRRLDKRWRYEKRAGDCLRRLENDLKSMLPNLATASRQAVAARPGSTLAFQQMIDQTFQTLAPRPQVRYAIGSAITSATPVAYVRDSAAVVEKWSTPAARYTPVIDDVVAQLKEEVRLSVNLRTCRALWLNATPPVSAATRSQIEACLTALRNDVQTIDKHLRDLAVQPAALKPTDITSWGEPTLRGAAIALAADVTEDIDRYLVDAHIVHKGWKPYESAAAPDLGPTVHRAMALRGLRDLVSLLLETEAVVLSLGEDGPEGVFDTADLGAKTQVAAALQIESDHFGGESLPWLHPSFGGSLAARPILNLQQKAPPMDEDMDMSTSDAAAEPDDKMDDSPGEDEEGPAIFPNYQQALVWDLHGRLNLAWQRLEASLVGKFGQSFLLNDKTLIDRGEFVGENLPDVSRAEWFKEALVEARVYDLDQQLIHGESSHLKPTFTIAYGWRWNDRFVPTPALVEAGTSTSDWQESRFVRFKWNIRNTIASRERYDKPTIVTFSFGVEREWWPEDTGLPTNTTILFSGDFDLGKIIKKSQ